jgi:hypothetical protein
MGGGWGGGDIAEEVGDAAAEVVFWFGGVETIISFEWVDCRGEGGKGGKVEGVLGEGDLATKRHALGWPRRLESSLFSPAMDSPATISFGGAMGINFAGPSLRMRLYKTGVVGCWGGVTASSKRLAPLSFARGGWVGVSGEMGSSRRWVEGGGVSGRVRWWRAVMGVGVLRSVLGVWGGEMRPINYN